MKKLLKILKSIVPEGPISVSVSVSVSVEVTPTAIKLTLLYIIVGIGVGVTYFEGGALWYVLLVLITTYRIVAYYADSKGEDIDDALDVDVDDDGEQDGDDGDTDDDDGDDNGGNEGNDDGGNKGANNDSDSEESTTCDCEESQSETQGRVYIEKHWSSEKADPSSTSRHYDICSIPFCTIRISNNRRQ